MRVIQGFRDDLPLDTVRGREGEAARIYFGAFDQLITAHKEAFRFNGRSRRPPLETCTRSFPSFTPSWPMM